jgi:hypothetical protein
MTPPATALIRLDAVAIYAPDNDWRIPFALSFQLKSSISLSSLQPLQCFLAIVSPHSGYSFKKGFFLTHLFRVIMLVLDKIKTPELYRFRSFGRGDTTRTRNHSCGQTGLAPFNASGSPETRLRTRFPVSLLRVLDIAPGI